MKAILGSLLCLVLFASECFALKGGPPYPTGTNIAGVYAGVLQQTFTPPKFGEPPECAPPSLGIFTLGIPTSGASTGDFIMFTRGRVFGGSIQGVSDPGSAQLTAILDATFTYMITSVDPPISVTASVTGTLTATITAPNNPLSPTSAFLNGSAFVDEDNGFISGNGDPLIVCTLPLEVMGFRQSTVAPAGGTLTPPSP